MKILTFTSLFPNREQPRHGIFVAERLRHFQTTYPEFEHNVVAPVPWFPSRNPAYGHYATLASVPYSEERNETEILHPRYPVIPKVGMNLAPLLMVASLLPYLRRLHRENPFDLIDAHFLYPDGIAAVVIGHALNLPVVVTARGNDLSLYPGWFVPRVQLRWCLRHADALITVCQALADAAIDLLPEVKYKTHVLRNGVDLERFHPQPRQEIRRDMVLDRFTLLSVGHLIERKGHHLVIEALAKLPDTELLIAGDGPWQERLKSQAREQGVSERVRFLGHVNHDDLARYYSAADALVLASSREGWANVLLEAMACGTPVVATAIWGTPEVVLENAAGQLIPERTPESIIAGIQRLRDSYPTHEATRKYAERFSWRDTSQKQYEIFRSLQRSEAGQLL